MWFKFPKGVESAQIELQNFGAEYKDGDGRGYFRAPDHFAANILLLPGFEMTEQPEGAPDDLPKDDIARGNTIEALGFENSALRARLSEIAADRDEWKLKAIEATTQLGNAEADLKELQEKYDSEASEKTVNNGAVMDSTVELGSKAKTK